MESMMSFPMHKRGQSIVLLALVLTLLLLAPFSYKLMQHLKPFAIVVLNGEITVYSVDSPNGFEW